MPTLPVTICNSRIDRMNKARAFRAIRKGGRYSTAPAPLSLASIAALAAASGALVAVLSFLF